MLNGNFLTACDALPSNNISSLLTSFPKDLGDFLVVSYLL